MGTIVIIIVLVAIYVYINGVAKISNPLTLFNNVIKAKNFSNVVRIYSNGYMNIFTADTDGENFIIGFNNSLKLPSTMDISTLNDKAAKMHIHNIVYITAIPIPETTITYKIMKKYSIDIWDQQKIDSFIYGDLSGSYTSSVSSNTSVLKTSNTSDDTCDIDTNSNDPIQDGALHTHSLFSIFDKKIERL